MKTLKTMLLVLVLCMLFPFCNLPKHINKPLKHSTTKKGISVTGVPASFAFDTFYKKYIDADGIPVISSGKVPDEALLEARTIIIVVLRKIPAVRDKIISNKGRVAIMSVSELPTNIPEHRDLNTAFPETNWDTRGRGYGATLQRPATSCAEENLLCYPIDPYKGENILVHEFAHTIHLLGLRYTDPSFEEKLKAAYDNAKKKGIWSYTYAISNLQEYWAEGVQDWFNVNLVANPANGIHNEVHTRAQLMLYDPKLYDLISSYFLDDNEKVGCQSK